MFQRIFRKTKADSSLEQLPPSALKSCLAARPCTFHDDWASYSYLALDFETTGLNAKRDQLLSMGYVVLKEGRILLGTGRHTVIKGDEQVGQSATLHHITDDSRSLGLTLDTALEQLFTQLHGAVLITHYSHLELSFLKQLVRTRYGSEFSYPVIDTLKLQQRILRNYPSENKEGSLRLDQARAFHHLPRYRAHNALTDAQACAELFLAQMTHLAPNGIQLSHLLART
ncbi:MAG: hypothetical protein KC422_22780 [Trueperaceae bacterium]|nr:hypothetical protein [Trueperaceae bacterium]